MWLTGLSGSGKSTIARELERKLFLLGKRAYVLDGDNIRSGLNSDLGFSPEDRKENIRRIGEVARLFADAGLICVVAFISPYRTDRDTARRLLPEGRFIEVYVNAPLEVCEQRDPKGLYAKARANVLREFTGISSPYEPPRSPELALRTDLLTVGESVAQVLKRLRSFNCRLRRDYPPQAGAFCNSRCTRNTTLSQREPPARRSPPAAGVYPLSKHQ